MPGYETLVSEGGLGLGGLGRLTTWIPGGARRQGAHWDAGRVLWKLHVGTRTTQGAEVSGQNVDGDGQGSFTPQQFNIAPEKLPSQKVSSLPTIHFQGLC